MASNYPDDMPFWDEFFDRFEPVCPVCESEIIKTNHLHKHLASNAIGALIWLIRTHYLDEKTILNRIYQRLPHFFRFVHHLSSVIISLVLDSQKIN